MVISMADPLKGEDHNSPIQHLLPRKKKKGITFCEQPVTHDQKLL